MHHRLPQIDDRDQARPLGAGTGIEKAGEIGAARPAQDQHQHGGGNDDEFFLAAFFALPGIFFVIFFPGLIFSGLCVFLFRGACIFFFVGVVVFIVAHGVPPAQFVGWKGNAVWGAAGRASPPPTTPLPPPGPRRRDP